MWQFYNAKVINNGNNIIVTVADNRDIIEDVDSLAKLIKIIIKIMDINHK